VKHELAGSEYNVRRAQCEEAVQLLSRVLPQIRALRDVTLQELEQYRGRFNPTIYKRARHIISENQRVLRAASALQAGDIVKVGRLMQESHCSLRDDYEVSCRELDLMVGIANSQENVYGARMTGGGFGGCTVNLVVDGHAADFKYHVAREYRSQTGYEPQIWICKASQGVEELRSGDQGRI
jgi:galactokinase